MESRCRNVGEERAIRTPRQPLSTDAELPLIRSNKTEEWGPPSRAAISKPFRQEKWGIDPSTNLGALPDYLVDKLPPSGPKIKLEPDNDQPPTNDHAQTLITPQKTPTSRRPAR